MTRVRRIPCGTVNCYLLTGDRGSVLVDTGWAGYGEKLLSACLGQDVRLILLTHGHVDHIQNTAFLMERLGVPSALHPADLGLLADNRRQSMCADGLLGRLMLSLSRHSFRTQMAPAFSPSVWLEDGQSLEPWGVEARVVALPGHTSGCVGVELPGGALVVGDAMINLPRPRPAPLYHSREQLLASAEKIASMGGRTLYFGHGRPWNRPGG